MMFQDKDADLQLSQLLIVLIVLSEECVVNDISSNGSYLEHVFLKYSPNCRASAAVDVSAEFFWPSDVHDSQSMPPASLTRMELLVSDLRNPPSIVLIWVLVCYSDKAMHAHNSLMHLPC